MLYTYIARTLLIEIANHTYYEDSHIRVNIHHTSLSLATIADTTCYRRSPNEIVRYVLHLSRGLPEGPVSAHEVFDREEADAAAAVGFWVHAEVEVVVNAQALRVPRDVHERAALPHARDELATPAHVVVLAILHDSVRAQ